MTSSDASPASPEPPIPPDLLFLEPKFLSSTNRESAHVQDSSIPSQKETATQSNHQTSWSARFKNSINNLTKSTDPIFSADGIPTVMAPESVLLGSSQIWKNHLVGHFHGLPPSSTKIFSDLNPIWGRNGRISVKRYADTVCLFYIPCEETRKWVLDVGYWQSGNCSFTVSEWSSEVSLAPVKLISAPIWVIFRGIPRSLWSFQGFSSIGSGVGVPLHTDFTELPPYTVGIVRLKVRVNLKNKKPPSVRVTDTLGSSVLITAEYPKLPPRCGHCDDFGHRELRCPVIATKGDAQVDTSPPVIIQPPLTDETLNPPDKTQLSQSPINTQLHNSSSSHGTQVDELSSSGWTKVVRRSKPPPPSESGEKSIWVPKPLSPATIISEENMIKDGQRILRNRAPSSMQIVPYNPFQALANLAEIPTFANSRSSRKQIRQQILASLSNEDPEDEDQLNSPSSPSVGTAPRGRSRSRSVSPST